MDVRQRGVPWKVSSEKQLLENIKELKHVKWRTWKHEGILNREHEGIKAKGNSWKSTGVLCTHQVNRQIGSIYNVNVNVNKQAWKTKTNWKQNFRGCKWQQELTAQLQGEWARPWGTKVKQVQTTHFNNADGWEFWYSFHQNHLTLVLTSLQSVVHRLPATAFWHLLWLPQLFL